MGALNACIYVGSRGIYKHTLKGPDVKQTFNGFRTTIMEITWGGGLKRNLSKNKNINFIQMTQYKYNRN